MDSPLKCFNKVLITRLSLPCSSNELLGYLLAILHHNNCYVKPPVHIRIIYCRILDRIDAELHGVDHNEWCKLKESVEDIVIKLERAGFNWPYSYHSNYKASSVMDHTTGLSDEAGCLYTGEARRSDIFKGNGR